MVGDFLKRTYGRWADHYANMSSYEQRRSKYTSSLLWCQTLSWDQSLRAVLRAVFSLGFRLYPGLCFGEQFLIDLARGGYRAVPKGDLACSLKRTINEPLASCLPSLPVASLERSPNGFQRRLSLSRFDWALSFGHQVCERSDRVRPCHVWDGMYFATFRRHHRWCSQK